ncbi:MAG: T9SS type A sorting domain-containing protein [Ignavibacteriales bacterium]|nr:T9SS type A sorting domain-containing protein [Ignavibacteriales bacterium]
MKYIFMCVFLMFILQIQFVTAQSVANGNFEQGPASGWIQYSSGGYGLIGTAAFFNSTSITPQVFPRSGQYMARIGGFSYEQNSIKQTVTLPNTPKVYMGMFYQDRASTTSECGGLWVGAQIRVFVAGTAILDQYQCYYNTVNNWTYVYFDLSAAAGQTVEIGFRADAASSVWSYLYLDDITISSTVSVPEDYTSIQLDKFRLDQNYPNPFNPTTTINYQIPTAGNVSLKVNDMLGKEVATLVNEEKPAGNYQVDFDGSRLSGGIYFYQIKTGSFVQTRKMLLLK